MQQYRELIQTQYPELIVDTLDTDKLIESWEKYLDIIGSQQSGIAQLLPSAKIEDMDLSVRGMFVAMLGMLFIREMPQENSTTSIMDMISDTMSNI